MTLYIYESHLGGFYCTNEKQDIESLYCEQCGDYDNYLGKAENAYDVADILRTKVELFDMGGYSMEYCTKFFNACCDALGGDNVEYKVEDENKEDD